MEESLGFGLRHNIKEIKAEVNDMEETRYEKHNKSSCCDGNAF